MNKKIIYLLIILFASVPSMFSCKVQSGQRSSRAQSAQAKRVKAREDHRAYVKAYKRHLSLQDDRTKKRIKKNIKEQKKSQKRTTGKKGRTKVSCPNQQA